MRLEFGSTLKPSENVKLQAYEVSATEKQDMLQYLLRKEPGRVLVFARTKRGADRIAKGLSHRGINAATIHGDRSQSQRTAALTGFQQGRYRVLVATDVASRGIHVEDIAHVINYDLPEVAENFIHRVGRTGRAGRTGSRVHFGRARSAHRAVPDGAHPWTFASRRFAPSVSSREIEAQNRDEFASKVARNPTPPTRRSVQLPGEFLQTQLAV